MQIIRKPVVEVIAQSQFIGSQTFDIPDDGDDHTKIGSFSAKVCYDSHGKEGRANEANQQAVMSHAHGSVLEHSTVSLYITGITRGLTLELNRHRSFAISQRSTRYTAEEDVNIVLDPYYASLYDKYETLLTDATVDDVSGITDFNIDELNLLTSHISSLETSFDAYGRDVTWLSKCNPYGYTGFELRKWARGKARALLPHALETRGVWTNNHRGFRWFIESRSDAHAEDEIRRLADAVLQTLKKTTALYYDDFENTGDVRGIPVWKPKYRKV
jgi:thymidylate synthase (FAD)